MVEQGREISNCDIKVNAKLKTNTNRKLISGIVISSQQ